VLVRYMQGLPFGTADSADVAYLPSGTGAVATNVQSKLREFVSVFDFMTPAQIADVQSGAALLDVTAAVQAAIDFVNISNGTLYFPAGNYRLDGQISFPANVNLVGAGRGATTLTCNFAGIQFQLTETLAYQRVAHMSFVGNGSNTGFSTGAGTRGFFGVVWDTCRFTSFGTAIEKKFSLFCVYLNTQFRQCGVGVDMLDGPGTYHNVNTFDTSYFADCTTAGLRFKSASNGSSLTLISTAFDTNAIGLDAYRPVEIINGYFERNETGIKLNSTNAQIGRCYWLGDSSGPSTKVGLLADASRVIQTGVWSLTDTFDKALRLTNASTLINLTSGAYTSFNIDVQDTSVQYGVQDVLALVTATPPEPVNTFTLTDLSTTPVALGASRFGRVRHTMRFRTAGGQRHSLTFGLMVVAGTYRVKIFDCTGSFTQVNNTEFNISGLGDSRTYTFTISGTTGVMSVNADAATSGTTTINVQAFGSTSV
jgi:hypothetical protein